MLYVQIIARLKEPHDLYQIEYNDYAGSGNYGIFSTQELADAELSRIRIQYEGSDNPYKTDYEVVTYELDAPVLKEG